jgi:hypothetical protein
MLLVPFRWGSNGAGTATIVTDESGQLVIMLERSKTGTGVLQDDVPLGADVVPVDDQVELSCTPSSAGGVTNVEETIDVTVRVKGAPFHVCSNCAPRDQTNECAASRWIWHSQG